MATEGKNLSDFDRSSIPDLTGKKFGIVVSEWNGQITGNLLKGAIEGFYQAGVPESSIIIKYVPGTFELALGALRIIQSESLDGVVCLGSVIRGETAHFDYVCEASAKGIMDVNLKNRSACGIRSTH